MPALNAINPPFERQAFLPLVPFFQNLGMYFLVALVVSSGGSPWVLMRIPAPKADFVLLLKHVQGRMVGGGSRHAKSELQGCVRVSVCVCVWICDMCKQVLKYNSKHMQQKEQCSQTRAVQPNTLHTIKHKLLGHVLGTS